MHRMAVIVLGSMIIWSSCKSDDEDRGIRVRRHSETSQREDDDCGLHDGIEVATIDYFNPKTGYSATYTLDVEVENCQVVQIDFNNGGYLGPDHIEPADIDEDGNARIEDDKGRTFDVHIGRRK